MWGLSPSCVTSSWWQMKKQAERCSVLAKGLVSWVSHSENLAQTWLQKQLFLPAMLCRPLIQQAFTWFLPQAKRCAVLCRERMFRLNMRVGPILWSFTAATVFLPKSPTCTAPILNISLVKSTHLFFSLHCLHWWAHVGNTMPSRQFHRRLMALRCHLTLFCPFPLSAPFLSSQGLVSNFSWFYSMLQVSGEETAHVTQWG